MHGHIGLITLGAVFLAVTGGEALYADLGHFGRLPIQTGLARPRAAVAADQLFRPGRAGARASCRDRESVLSPRSRDAAAADDCARDRRDRDREPGRDHRRLFAGATGDPARPAAAARHRAHLGGIFRTDLPAARQHRAARRRHAAGRPVPHLERARLGLWHRGRHHDGGRRRAGLHRDLASCGAGRPGRPRR